MKIRLDQLLVQRSLADSREKAQRLVLAGAVRVNGQVADKPGHTVLDAPETLLTVDSPEKFVGRGGQKLEKALDVFPITVTGRICLDVGASTGGFTDCLLQRGAVRVYAVDVGRGQLDWRLRNDPRVVLREGVNARYLKPGDLPEPVSLCVVDVSFISLTKILPAVIPLMVPGDLVTLIKPQFEAGPDQVGKGGVVRDPAVRERVVDGIRLFGGGLPGLQWQDHCESPIKGPAGNVEFLAWWKRI
jgi:23S rRNA (cytidine1920-2'-O)/16S rRNA (cytidine1409-2'-O)-methyltransferase